MSLVQGQFNVTSVASTDPSTYYLALQSADFIGSKSTSIPTSQFLSFNPRTNTLAVSRLNVGSRGISTASMPAGTVLQVVQATTTTAVATTASSWYSTGFSATITPTSATSKILISYGANCRIAATAGAIIQTTLFRSTVGLAPLNIAPQPTRGFTQLQASVANQIDAPCFATYLDLPYNIPSSTVTVTGTVITNNIITAANSLTVGSSVVFNSGFNGVTAGITYYVISSNLSSSGFNVSTVLNGPSITINTTGSVSGSFGVVTSPSTFAPPAVLLPVTYTVYIQNTGAGASVSWCIDGSYGQITLTEVAA